MYKSNEAPHSRTLCSLTVVHPHEHIRSEHITHKNLTLGRNERCELQVDHPTVSRRHLELRWDAQSGRHLASDLKSRNGSHINGIALGAIPRLVEDNDVLQLGDVLAVYERYSGPIPDPDAPEPLFDAIPGDALSVRALRERLLQFARNRQPVLVTGETGAGKEKIARVIHTLSGRPGEFIVVNCGALSPQLVESELFGHERGAFTGATYAKPGLFRAAAGGTLFLDEIGELPLELQPKLLRAAENGMIMPVGNTTEHRVDVRIVAATHRDLLADIESDRFRRDLYARLARQDLRVPPLRERRVDILRWLGLFLKRAADEGVREKPIDAAGILARLTPCATAAIVGGPWSENLRGLERLANELVHHTDASAIKTWMLPSWALPARPAPTRGPTAPPMEGPPVPRPDRLPKPAPKELEEALVRHNGSIRAVAAHFGRDRSLIRRWIVRFNITLPSPQNKRPSGGANPDLA